MSSNSLFSIPVTINNASDAKLGQHSIRAVLVEIKEALSHFDKTGKRHGIDLNALPLSEFDIAKLLKLLGQGEVLIQISTLGESEVYETLLDAVWVIKHKNENDKVTAILIEIGTVPDIVLSEIDELEDLNVRIDDLIETL